LLLGKAETVERAVSVADFLIQCPYCASATNAGNLVLAVLSLPASRKWWFESITQEPKNIIGLQEAEIFYTDKKDATSPL
jgi:hypothetical protein